MPALKLAQCGVGALLNKVKRQCLMQVAFIKKEASVGTVTLGLRKIKQSSSRLTNENDFVAMVCK